MDNVSHITDFHVGYEFAPIRFQLQHDEVDMYLKSVGEFNTLFKDQKFVPITALAAYGLRGILLEINLPGGAIHSAQETTVLRAMRSDEVIVFRAKLAQNAIWKGWRFVTVDYVGVDEDGNQILQGRSTVVIPQDDIVGSGR